MLKKIGVPQQPLNYFCLFLGPVVINSFSNENYVLQGSRIFCRRSEIFASCGPRHSHNRNRKNHSFSPVFKMRTMSIHVCGISFLKIATLLVWTTLSFLKGNGPMAIAEAAAVEHNNNFHVNIDPELVLTKEEKFAFDKLKSAVYVNISHPFLRQDIYLLRWIRAKDLDVNVAVQDMFQFLDFLRTNHVSDKILEEDWSDMQEDNPYHFDAVDSSIKKINEQDRETKLACVDRQGRPVVYGSAGDGWNIRRTILQGKRNRLMRYTYYLVWQLMHKFMEINKSQPNITTCLVLVNMDGFNVFQHSCGMCIAAYINLLDVYERYIPGYVKDIVVINAPQAYWVLLEIMRPVLSQQTRNTLRVFNTNKNGWKPFLDERVDPNQLPADFGGNRVDTKEY